MSSEQDERFASVRLESDAESPCSPEIDPFDTAYRGIKVAAPSRVDPVPDRDGTLGPATRFPVCIAMQLSLREIVATPDVRANVVLLLDDDESGASFSGNLVRDRPAAPVPPSSLPDDELDRRVARFYFNVNVARHVRLPGSDARYRVRARFGSHTSDSVTVHVMGARP